MDRIAKKRNLFALRFKFLVVAAKKEKDFFFRTRLEEKLASLEGVFGCLQTPREFSDFHQQVGHSKVCG